MSDQEGMYDPLHGRVDVQAAEQALGIDDEQRSYLRLVSLLKILQQRMEISDVEIDLQYETDLKEQLTEVSISLNSLVRGGLND